MIFRFWKITTFLPVFFCYYLNLPFIFKKFGKKTINWQYELFPCLEAQIFILSKNLILVVFLLLQKITKWFYNYFAQQRIPQKIHVDMTGKACRLKP